MGWSSQVVHPVRKNHLQDVLALGGSEISRLPELFEVGEKQQKSAPETYKKYTKKWKKTENWWFVLVTLQN